MNQISPEPGKPFDSGRWGPALVLSTAGPGTGLTVLQASPPRSADDIRRRLVVLLGGRAAEQLVFGQPSCGSGGDGESDLAQATLLATIAAAAMGCDEEVGLAWLGMPELSSWLGMPELSSLPKMLATDAMLARRVRLALAEAYGQAVDSLVPHRTALEALARALLDHRALDGPEVTAILAAHGAGGVAPLEAVLLPRQQSLTPQGLS